MKNEELVNLLKKKKFHITVAESCTGGLTSSYIVDVPGSSDVFEMGFVLYSNEAKVSRIGVREDLIEKYGVVSEDVVAEMADCASFEAGADIAIAISGIAGPDGGSKEKPVGMVCFGYHILGNLFLETQKFGNLGRNEVRKKAAEHAIDRCYDLLVEVLEGWLMNISKI